MSKLKHWTKEELALLAHLIGTYLEGSNDILDACEFASKKLGRSKMACYGQYHNKMRGKDLASFALEEEKVSDYNIDKENETLEAIEFLNNLAHCVDLENPKTNPKITIYSGFKQDCEIIVHTKDMIVAEFGGSIITIKF